MMESTLASLGRKNNLLKILSNSQNPLEGKRTRLRSEEARNNMEWDWSISSSENTSAANTWQQLCFLERHGGLHYNAWSWMPGAVPLSPCGGHVHLGWMPFMPTFPSISFQAEDSCKRIWLATPRSHASCQQQGSLGQWLWLYRKGYNAGNSPKLRKDTQKILDSL